MSEDQATTSLTRAALGVDDDRLAEPRRESLADHASHAVGRPTSSVGDNNSDRTDGIVLGSGHGRCQGSNRQNSRAAEA
jgi:hypothetical protein